MYSVGKVRGHSNKTRRHDRNYDLSRRLKAVNDYFEEKAAEVLVDEASVEQLLKLYERIALEHEELEINSAGKALARLAAAGFCEVHETTVQITKDGLKFIESFDQPESE